MTHRYVHAKRRALERFGCDLTDDDLADILARVKATNPRGRQVRCCVSLPNGEIAVAVYDRRADQIKTFLFPERG